MNLHLTLSPKWLVTGIAISATTVATLGVLTVAGVLGPNEGATGVGGNTIVAEETESPDDSSFGDDEAQDAEESTPSPRRSGKPGSQDPQSPGGEPQDGLVVGGGQPGGGQPGGGQPGGGQPGGGNGGPNKDVKSFEISGIAQGLYPGGAAPLTLTLENPGPSAIRVTELTVKAANADKPGCSAANLIVPSYSDGSGSADDVVIPRRGMTTHTLQIVLRHDAPDACQNATWALTYAGRAVKA